VLRHNINATIITREKKYIQFPEIAVVAVAEIENFIIFK
jgi:hypothetical protein